MIDIHTHILPGMDDGARDAAESLAMIDKLKQQGVTGAVLTPHFYSHQETLEDFLLRREAAFKRISHADFSMTLGSETYLTESLFSYEYLGDLCLGKGKHLLLELPYTSKWGSSVYRQIDRLIDKYQVIPIIAHVERYEAIAKDREGIQQKLVDLGCLLQFNLESFIGAWSRGSSLRMFKHGWVDFLASDCHNLTTRPPAWDQEIFSKPVNGTPLGKGWNMLEKVGDILVDKDLSSR